MTTRLNNDDATVVVVVVVNDEGWNWKIKKKEKKINATKSKKQGIFQILSN